MSTPTTFELYFVFGKAQREGVTGLSLSQTKQLANIISNISELTWTRYDLNTMANWKVFDPDRFSVDAQTQRTAMIRMEGEGGVLLLWALGKRGEPPTLIIRLDASDGFPPEQALELWRATLAGMVRCEGITVTRSGIAPVALRDGYVRGGHGMPTVRNVDIAAWWTAIDADQEGVYSEVLGSGVTQGEPIGGLVTFCLLPSLAMPLDDVADHWLKTAENLSF